MGKKGKNKGTPTKLELAKKDGAGSSSVAAPSAAASVNPKSGKNEPKVEIKDAKIGSKPEDRGGDPSPGATSSRAGDVAPQTGGEQQQQIESATPSPGGHVAPQTGGEQIDSKDAKIGSKPEDKGGDPGPGATSSSGGDVAPQTGGEHQQQIETKGAKIDSKPEDRGGDPSSDATPSGGDVALHTDSEQQQQGDINVEGADSSPEDSGVDPTPEPSPSHVVNVASQTGGAEHQPIDVTDEETDSCPEDSGVGQVESEAAPKTTDENEDGEIDLFTMINKKRALRARYQRWRRRFEGAIRIAVVKESIRINCINDINKNLSDEDYAPLIGAFENFEVIIKNSALYRMLLATKLTYMDLLISHVELMLRDQRNKSNLIKDISFQKLRDLLLEQVTFLQKHLITLNEEFRGKFSRHSPHLQEVIKDDLQHHSTLKEMFKGLLDITNRMYCIWPKLFLSCINCIIIFIDSVDLFLSV